jgi:hypothetical protein
MRATRNRRYADRSAAGRRVLDGRRALIAGLFLGSLMLALGNHIGGFSLMQIRPGVAQKTLTDEDLATGSILLVPFYGNDCRLRLIENATWRIWDHGVVDCHSALEQSRARTNGWSAAGRIEVIRDGFFRR